MDWFFALESPTQVAIIGGLFTSVGAAAGAIYAAYRKPKPTGSAEIAALALDSSAVRQVAAAIEALNLTLIEQNKLAAKGGGELVSAMKGFTREVEELRREVRALSEKMR